MDNLPGNLSVQEALIWIATRNAGACGEASKLGFHNSGLVGVACTIAKYQHPGDPTIRDKSVQVVVLDKSEVEKDLDAVCDGEPLPNDLRASTAIAGVRGGGRSTPPPNYEYRQAEQELLAALRAVNFIAYTTDPAFRGTQRRRRSNGVYKIDAVHWLGREFQDQFRPRGVHYHVAAVKDGERPLHDISFKKNDILAIWPPEGGQKRGPKTGRPTDKDDWCRMAIEILESQKVLPGRGDITKIAKLILEKGRYPHALRTITKAIALTVHDWKKKHAKAA